MAEDLVIEDVFIEDVVAKDVVNGSVHDLGSRLFFKVRERDDKQSRKVLQFRLFKSISEEVMKTTCKLFDIVHVQAAGIHIACQRYKQAIP